MQTLLQDIRYALRQLRQSPTFTAIAILTLALGIGANTAVFSVMDALLLRALPVQNPNALYYLHIGQGFDNPPGAGNTGDGDTSFSEPTFEALRQRKDVFSDLIAYVPLSFGKLAVRIGNSPEEAEADEVSGNFFSGLTVPLARGRAFTPDDESKHTSVLVLSYDYWTRRFARNPSVLGQTIFLKGVPFTVIGVAAHGFNGVEAGSSTDFWIPLQNRPELNAWGQSSDLNTLYATPKWWCLPLIGRLQPGVTPKQASSALYSAFGQAAQIGIGTIDPKQWKPVLNFVPAIGIAGYNDQYRQPVFVLMALVSLVLLIAITNVALMLVARNAARQREFSLRLALGAGKLQLLRQLLTESSLLVATGAALGWAFAVFATSFLARLSDIESGLSPNRNVLFFTLGVSVIVAIVFGLAPLASALRAPVAGVLRSSSTNLSPDRRRALGGKFIIGAQIAICLVLLMAASMLLRTLRNYQTQDLGMQTKGLLAFGITPQGMQGRDQTLALYRRILDQVRSLPGVESASIAENRPGTGWSDNNGMPPIDGVPQHGMIRTNTVGPDFFHVLGTPLLLGRDIAEQDTATTPMVVVINQTFAKKFFPRSSPIGHQIGSKDHPARIIGVVADSKYTSVAEDPIPMAFGAYAQDETVGATQFEVRTQGDPLSLLPAIRRAVQQINPNLPLEQPMTQQAQFEKSYDQPLMFATLGGFFGILSALLVATGLYGTLSYRTERRSVEIGIRIALGAQRNQVLWMVLRESLIVAAAGVVIGLPLALFCMRYLDSMTYKLSTLDPLSAIAAFLCIALVVSLASLLPSRRASSIEPMQALRND
jgi:predicted permease